MEFFKEKRIKEGSKVGKISSDWGVISLGNICDRVSDGFHISPRKDPNGIPLIKTETIRDGEIDFKRAEKISINAEDD